jgi:hypothetical protein
MKAGTIVVVLAAALLATDLVQAQVTGGTGVVGFSLSVYGRVRLEVPAAGGTRQLDRLSFIAALDNTAVFDYTEDAENIEVPSVAAGGIADTIATVLTDNSYSFLEPNVSVRVTCFAWNTDAYYIAKFTTTNTNATPYTLWLGAFAIPKPANAYGGETVAYDATSKVAYYFRTGESDYIGLKLLSADPSSFHARDWDAYSPNPDADEAADSTRYQMTATPGFDADVVAGVNGSAFNLNAGEVTLAAGDSASVYYAVMYANSLPSLVTVATAAQARYNGVFTGVTPGDGNLPGAFRLEQNYPNPFNPDTRIVYTLAASGPATLKVYDVLGREVATLVDGVVDAGTHSAAFRGDGLASGVYLCRLTSGGNTTTRQMLLLR